MAAPTCRMRLFCLARKPVRIKPIRTRLSGPDNEGGIQMTASQQNDPWGNDRFSGWFEVEGDVDDFIFYTEEAAQSER